MSSQQQSTAATSQSTASSSKKKIFITGASGQTGRHVMKHLHQVAQKYEVCAGIYSEDKEKLEKVVKGCCEQAKTCPIDADDVESLVEAFKGVDDLFIIPTATDSKVGHARNYIRAAKRAGVKFVLVLSMTGAEQRNYFFADQFRDIEESVQREGIENFCILRSNFYMQNLLLYRDQIKQGSLPLPTHTGKFNPLDADDVGRAAQIILQDCSKHVGKWYNLTGPQSMNGEEMASICSKVLDRQVRWEDIPKETARKLLRSQNVPAAETQGLLEFYDLVKREELKEEWKNDFEMITGEKSTSLEEFLKRHKDELIA